MKSFDPKTISADKKKKIFTDLLIVTERGMGKRTPLTQYPTQKRGGQGVKVAETTDKTGLIANALSITEIDIELLITTKEAQAIKLPIRNIPQLQRSTQGVILMRFAKVGDTVAAITVVSESEAEK